MDCFIVGAVEDKHKKNIYKFISTSENNLNNILFSVQSEVTLQYRLVQRVTSMKSMYKAGN